MAWKKYVLQKTCSSKQNRQHVFVLVMLRNGIPRVCFYFFSTEQNSEQFFSSAERFGTEFREFSVPRIVSERNSESLLLFVPWYRIPSILLLCGTVRNGIPRVSVPWNSLNSTGTSQLFCLFRLPRNNFFVGNCHPCAAGSCPNTQRRPSVILFESKRFLQIKEELGKMGRKIRDFMTVAKFCTLVCRMQFLENNFTFRYNAWYLKQGIIES
jgi:hypothetical protein